MNKYTFVTTGNVQSKVGIPIVKYGSNWKDAATHLVDDINMVIKSSDGTPIEIDPDDYQTIAQFIIALNLLTPNDIIYVYEETTIYSVV